MTSKELARRILDIYANESRELRALDTILVECKELLFDKDYVRDNYTKGDCYAICEFLDALTMHNPDTIADVVSVLGYEKEHIRDLLIRLSCDIDHIIAKEQDERDDTDQMAEIMKLVHISGHDDYKGARYETCGRRIEFI